MRTTLTLDDDVAARLRRRLEERHGTLKGVVNDALRRGLDALDDDAQRDDEPYHLIPRDLGSPRIPSLDSVGEALEWGEGPGYS